MTDSRLRELWIRLRWVFLLVGAAFIIVPAWSARLGGPLWLWATGWALLGLGTGLLQWNRWRGAPAAVWILDGVVWLATCLGSGGFGSAVLPLHALWTVELVALAPPVAAAAAAGGALLLLVGVELLVSPLTAVNASAGLTFQGAFSGLLGAFCAATLRSAGGTERALGFVPGRSGSMDAKAQEQAIINEERVRLAREIHDGLGGTLSSLILQTEFILRQTQDPDLRAEVEDLKAQAEESIEELRRSLTMMRRDFDLHQTLMDHTERFGARNKIEAELKVAGRARRLPSEMQLALFRALQECLTNIQKHARASRVGGRLSYDGDLVTLTVTDDGVGFDPSKRPPGHYGLTNLEERARRFRGTVEVQSAPGEGTKVHLTLVIPAEGSHVMLEGLRNTEL